MWLIIDINIGEIIMLTLKDLVKQAKNTDRPVIQGPRLGGLTLGDLIHRTLEETFIGPRYIK